MKPTNKKEMTSPIDAAVERFDKKYCQKLAYIGNAGQKHVNQMKDFITKELTRMQQETAEEMIETLDIEVEAWMQVHEEQERTFQTKDFIEHLRKTVLSRISRGKV